MTRCADDYNDDPCKHLAEETCDACRKEFCWEHLLNVDMTTGMAMGEERVMCRECVTQECIRLGQENAELKQDVRMLSARVAELEEQLKQAKR